MAYKSSFDTDPSYYKPESSDKKQQSNKDAVTALLQMEANPVSGIAGPLKAPADGPVANTEKLSEDLVSKSVLPRVELISTDTKTGAPVQQGDKVADYFETRDDNTGVTTWKDANGNVVRHKDAAGKEFVHRIGPDGKEQIIADKPLHPLKGPINPNVGFETPNGRTQRGEELFQVSESLLKSAAKPNGDVDFKALGKIMLDTADKKELTEAEKFYVYEKVTQRLKEGRIDGNGQLKPAGSSTYRLTQEGSDVMRSKKGDVVRHIHISPTNDGYHGDLVYGEGTYKSGWATGKSGVVVHEALKAVQQGFKTDPIGMIFDSDATAKRMVDKGDEQQSYRQLEALQRMQCEGFRGYAEGWVDGFVDKKKRSELYKERERD